MIKPELLVPQVNTVGLVAHYKLWAGLTSTASVFDYALNGNTGTVTGATPAYPGFLFDAVDDEIDCASGSSIDDIFDGGATVSLWLLSSGRGQNNAGIAIGKAEWLFHMITDTTTMRFVREFVTTGGNWDITIAAGIWQHLVIVYDSSLLMKNPVIYLNGVSVSVTQTGEPDGAIISDATDNLIIGDGAGSTGSWDGKIGDVMLFVTEKTAAEAKSIFELTRWRYSV